MVAPIASRPLRCKSIGRSPMAQPPGWATRASPQRATRGPSTSEEARMVLTISYLAVGSESTRQLILVRCCARPYPSSTSAPIEVSSFRSVSMSRTWGIFSSTTSSSVRIAAAMQGRAEFLAPLTRIVPSSGLPPRMTNLSMRARGCSLFVSYLLQLERCIFNRQPNIAIGLCQAAYRLGLVHSGLEHHQRHRHAAPGRLDGEHSLLAI